MTREDRQLLLRIARWICEQKYFRVKKIRQLAGTEENYLILIREVDRVKSQVQHARSLEAEATLTLVDWLLTLERFQWRCAYCQERSFEIMSHVVPLPRGGTTSENCVPSCYSCSTGKGKMHARLRVQALQRGCGRQASQDDAYSTGSNASSLNR
ncbi:MAG TPA: HNH endonuclease signature motif containing protein [Ktedonobacteraceae bacterium]|nr:HNH endonuclease signature motif containing protein [Ktedonobacteraceae bacterium]